MIRCSSLPLLVACPASGAQGELSIDTHDPTATAGTAIHAAIPLALQGKPYPALSREEEEIVGLAKEWAENWLYKAYHGFTWRFEVAMRNDDFSGKLDHVGECQDQAVIVDWKATYIEADHTPQLMGYSKLAFDANPFIEQVTIIVPLLRLGRAQPPKELGRDYVEGWHEDLKRNVLEHPEIYRPGEHCRRCHRRLDCPALERVNRSTAQLVASPDFEKHLIPLAIPELHHRMKMLEEAIALYKEWEKMQVLENGPVSLLNGKMLKAVEQPQEEIDVLKSWGQITGTFADSDLPKFMGISKGKMLDVLAAAFPRGKKKPACEAFMKQLRDDGAVKTKTITKVMEVAL